MFIENIRFNIFIILNSIKLKLFTCRWFLFVVGLGLELSVIVHFVVVFERFMPSCH